MASSIPDSAIEDVKSRIDIADLISSYGIKVVRSGASCKAVCPFHRDKNPSMAIQPDRGYYHCFGCGESGDAISFVQKMDGLTFVEAVKRLASRCGVTIEERDDPESGLRKKLFALHAELAAFYRRCLKEAREAEPARRYLGERALDGDTAESFQLGYAPVSAAAMLKWAGKYGFSPEDMAAAGILLPPRSPGGRWYNSFAGRLVFPVRDKMGRVVAFSCRTLEKDPAKMRGGKYVNSRDTAIFKKSDVLYAFDKASPRILAAPGREAIVCEGQIDVIRCHACGFQTAVAALGTAFTEEHVRIIGKSADSAILVFDADGAGRKAGVRTGGRFLAAGMPVRVATLPEGEDPDSLLRIGGADAFRARLDAAESVVSFQIRMLREQEPNPGTISAVARISRAAMETISLCSSAVMRASLAAEAAELLGVPVSALEEDLKEVERKEAAKRAMRIPRKPVPAPDVPRKPDPPAQTGKGVSVLDSGNDAASSANNPPPPRELAFCGFLFKHEKDPEVAALVEECVKPGLFAHPFTGAFTAAWLDGGRSGTDGFAEYCRNLPPEEGRWFGRISSDERDTLCEKTVSQQAKDFLRLLWADAVERRLGAMDARQDAENDRRRLGLSMIARKLQRGAWSAARPLMVQDTLDTAGA